MNLEYLFPQKLDFKEDISKRLTIEACETEAVYIKSKKVTIVLYRLVGENLKNAKNISTINKQIRTPPIMSEYNKQTLLKNDSSAYFNKKIYPFINTFELKLRNLLYLARETNQNNPESKKIDQLEQKTFGDVFYLLFMSSFLSKTEKILKKNENITKPELLSQLEELPDSISWDILIGENIIKELRTNHKRVKDYRNDVMHAHQIDYKNYLQIKKLYTTINNQLDDAITDIVEENTINFSESFSEFNTNLYTFIQELQSSLLPFTEMAKVTFEVVKHLPIQ